MQPEPHPQPSGCEPRAGHPGTPRVFSAPSVPPALPKLEGQRPLPVHPGRKEGHCPRQKMPKASQPPPLEEPTAFSDPPWAPLPPKAVVTLGMQHLPRMNFFLFFKCLHKLQTSGTRQSRPVPCPPSPTLPLALGVGGHGGCPSPGSPGSAGRTTAGVSTRAVPLPCAAASRAFLWTGCRSWSQRLCRSLLSEVHSCRASERESETASAQKPGRL